MACRNLLDIALPLAGQDMNVMSARGEMASTFIHNALDAATAVASWK
jgi:hypothetical protein